MVNYLSPCWSLYTYEEAQYNEILENLDKYSVSKANLVVTGNGLRKASTFDWWYGFLSNVILNSGKMDKMSTRQHLEVGRFLKYGIDQGYIENTHKIFTDFVQGADIEDTIEKDSIKLEASTNSLKKSVYSGYSKLFISKAAKERLQKETDHYLVRVIEREDLNKLAPLEQIKSQYSKSLVQTRALAVITPIYWSIANMLGRVNFDEETYRDVKTTIQDMEYSTHTNQRIYEKPKLNPYHKMILERVFNALEPVVEKQPHAENPIHGALEALTKAKKDDVVNAFYDTLCPKPFFDAPESV